MEYFNDLFQRPLWSTTVLLLVLSCFYLVALGFYRLYLCPIANFPGPRLAALTHWYEFYYDVVKGGQYEFQFERLHNQYGPVIRINPAELHVMDPDFHEILYAGGTKRRHKWGRAYKVFGADMSSFSTADHDLHRLRRFAVNPSFSKRAVVKLEPVLRELVETLCRRFREWQKTQKPLRVRDAYSALTLDVITEYSFGLSFDTLNHPDLNIEATRSADNLVKTVHVGRQFNFLFPIMKTLPDWLVIRLFPDMANNLGLQATIKNRVSNIQNSDPVELQQNTANIIHRILQSDLPPEEKAQQRIVEEAQTFLGAGTTTTADTLERATFELVSNTSILAKLKDELHSAMPNSHQLPSLQKLEQLPYLSAVISESLRIASPAPSRFNRIAPDENLKIGGYTIPAGTPISMSGWFMHYRNPCFPDPEVFRPERWLIPDIERRQLEKYLVPFSRGTRMCLGMNLANAELYLTLAAIFSRFDMELYETTAEEIRYVRDYLVPFPYEGSERLRVIIKN